jgi:hypothetical protein
MEIDAILCDHAQAAEGKLFISGGGIDRSFVSPEPPHMIGIGLAALIKVPYTATNQLHHLTLNLVDDDGAPVRPMTPPDMPEAPPLEVSMPFNLGRPPGLQPGEPQLWPVAININLPLPRLANYFFVLSVDGTELKRLGLRVMTMPQGPGVMMTGPAAPGPVG